jgi:hypothetical protein
MRIHKVKLSPDQRYIGNTYVAEEFRLNKKANDKQRVEFVKEWYDLDEVIIGSSIWPF